ncbi:hypothetical protein ABIC78_004268 [Novosphingobium sp. 1529]
MVAWIRLEWLAGMVEMRSIARFCNIDADKKFCDMFYGSSSGVRIGSAHPCNPRITSEDEATSPARQAYNSRCYSTFPWITDPALAK